MASLLDALIKAGSMSKLSVFSTAFDKNEKGKVLMLPGPASFGGTVFDASSGLILPKGELAVAPVRSGPALRPWLTGDVGGGTWLLSAHTAHLKEAVDFVTWVQGDDAWQDRLPPATPLTPPQPRSG